MSEKILEHNSASMASGSVVNQEPRGHKFESRLGHMPGIAGPNLRVGHVGGSRSMDDVPVSLMFLPLYSSSFLSKNQF